MSIHKPGHTIHLASVVVSPSRRCRFPSWDPRWSRGHWGGFGQSSHSLAHMIRVHLENARRNIDLIRKKFYDFVSFVKLIFWLSLLILPSICINDWIWPKLAIAQSYCANMWTMNSKPTHFILKCIYSIQLLFLISENTHLKSIKSAWIWNCTKMSEFT